MCELLNCTPHGSKIENHIDNTSVHSSEDEGSEDNTHETLLPVQVTPKISQHLSQLSLIKKDLHNGNIKNATRKLTPGGLALLDQSTQGIIKAKYQDNSTRQQENNTSTTAHMVDFDNSNNTIDFYDDIAQAATIGHI